MITNEHVDLITFTGGVPVGKMIADKAGYKRCVLELGGNAPFIVMDDADIERAATLAVAGATQEPAQPCTVAQRGPGPATMHDSLSSAFADERAPRRAAQPSTFRCCARSTASASSGTALPIVDPAATAAFLPIVTGAIRFALQPIFAPSPMTVRSFFCQL